MAYMALYRKFRPRTFGQVTGQDHVVRTLENQIRNGRIGHAYLFTGTRGTGKTSVAKLFARAINCLDPRDGEPCNECENCRAALKDSFLDIREVDAASNTSVDDVRSIIDEVRYTPVKGKYKVYIIDEVHMLSSSAFNAFLKTLEEPPEYVVFILATTEPHKLPVTILSRCQRYDFRRIGSDRIAENLAMITAQEGVEAQKEALDYIARAGDGSMRDSVSLLDKCITFSLGEPLTYENVLSALGAVDIDIFSALFGAVSSGDACSAILKIEEAASEGRDMTRFVSDLMWYVRNLLLLKADPETGPEVFGVSPEDMVILKKDAAASAQTQLMRYIRVLSDLLGSLRQAQSKQILIEVAFIKLAKPETESDISSLHERIQRLEERVQELEAGGAAAGAARPEAFSAVHESPRAQPETPAAQEYAREEQACIPEAAHAEKPQAGEGGRAEPAAAQAKGPAQEAVFSWGDIAAAAQIPRLRVALRKCRVRAEGADLVVLSVDEEMHQQKEYLESQREQIELLINRIIPDRVKVAVRADAKDAYVPAPPSDGSGEEFPEELLKNINFDIGTEEE